MVKVNKSILKYLFLIYGTKGLQQFSNFIVILYVKLPYMFMDSNVDKVSLGLILQ